MVSIRAFAFSLVTITPTLAIPVDHPEAGYQAPTVDHESVDGSTLGYAGCLELTKTSFAERNITATDLESSCANFEALYKSTATEMFEEKAGEWWDQVNKKYTRLLYNPYRDLNVTEGDAIHAEDTKRKILNDLWVKPKNADNPWTTTGCVALVTGVNGAHGGPTGDVDQAPAICKACDHFIYRAEANWQRLALSSSPASWWTESKVGKFFDASSNDVDFNPYKDLLDPEARRWWDGIIWYSIDHDSDQYEQQYDLLREDLEFPRGQLSRNDFHGYISEFSKKDAEWYRPSYSRKQSMRRHQFAPRDEPTDEFLLKNARQAGEWYGQHCAKEVVLAKLQRREIQYNDPREKVMCPNIAKTFPTIALRETLRCSGDAQCRQP